MDLSSFPTLTRQGETRNLELACGESNSSQDGHRSCTISNLLGQSGPALQVANETSRR